MSADDHGWPPDVAKQVKRMCRTSTGKRKRRYRRAQAFRAVERTNATAAYCCPVCGWWHIGTVRAR